MSEAHALEPEADYFDHPDYLNEDGTVTITMEPGNWRRYGISPDTYELFKGDGWEETVLEGLKEDHPELKRDLMWDDVIWNVDFRGVIRGLSEVLAEWIAEELREAGLTSVRDVKVTDVWSPKEYNFTTDGFTMELTCDPAELRGLSEDFDVDQWAHEYYRSVDGFMSFVTSRMNNADWHADYDGQFRIESILHGLDPHDEDRWRYAVWEAEWDVYESNSSPEVKDSALEYMESGYTLAELEEWAASFGYTQPETLPLEES